MSHLTMAHNVLVSMTPKDHPKIPPHIIRELYHDLHALHEQVILLNRFDADSRPERSVFL